MKSFFIGFYNKSIIITYLGIIISIIGIYCTLNNLIGTALICLILSGLCDLFDGMYARRFKRTDNEKLFGIEIDSLADVVNFIVFPVILFYQVGLDKSFHLVILIIYALTAITRLGYFNVNAKSSGNDEVIKYYTGLPVTYIALIFPLLFILLSFIDNADLVNIIYSISVFIISILFILKIKIFKPKGIAYAAFLFIAIIIINYIVFRGL